MVSLSDINTYKRLVAIGSEQFWYEGIDMAAGKMVKLDDSEGQIDTADQLNIFELNQKVFIVNGSNKKVADFINTKLTCSALTNPPAHGDLLTQDQTGDNFAYMIVDYVDKAKTTIYGFAYYGGDATAFNTDNTVASSDGIAVMDPSSFIPSVVTNGPHWYDWTTYPDCVDENSVILDYGDLPAKAYIGCNYRGRAVIAGSLQEPFQWYMSRQGNPWDFVYAANDVQSAVAGGNADAGKIGDMIRCLIPRKDDYLVFGCTNSIWYLAGDPASGGSLNDLDLTTGIFGSKSYCFDNKGNLYFWGHNGIYRTTIPGQPECISEQSLPRLVKNETVNPETYRITMGYDQKRQTVLICITKISDGTNSNYAYNLATKGFFPESYPDECGPYSLFHYKSNDSTYTDLLIGSKDGYIRHFDDSAKDDDAGASGDIAIDSHVSFGPFQIASDSKFEGKLTGLIPVTAGGQSGGNDSDDITCKIFTEKSAEGVIEKLLANTNPRFSKTVKAPGRFRQNILRQKIRGVYAGIRIGNDETNQTWGFEQLLVDAVNAGRLK